MYLNKKNKYCVLWSTLTIHFRCCSRAKETLEKEWTLRFVWSSAFRVRMAISPVWLRMPCIRKSLVINSRLIMLGLVRTGRSISPSLRKWRMVLSRLPLQRRSNSPWYLPLRGKQMKRVATVLSRYFFVW